MNELLFALFLFFFGLDIPSSFSHATTLVVFSRFFFLTFLVFFLLCVFFLCVLWSE